MRSVFPGSTRHFGMRVKVVPRCHDRRPALDLRLAIHCLHTRGAAQLPQNLCHLWCRRCARVALFGVTALSIIAPMLNITDGLFGAGLILCRGLRPFLARLACGRRHTLHRAAVPRSPSPRRYPAAFFAAVPRQQPHGLSAALPAVRRLHRSRISKARPAAPRSCPPVWTGRGSTRPALPPGLPAPPAPRR